MTVYASVFNATMFGCFVLVSGFATDIDQSFQANQPKYDGNNDQHADPIWTYMTYASRQQSIIMFQKLPCMMHSTLAFSHLLSHPITTPVFPLAVLADALRTSIAFFECNLHTHNLETIEQIKIEPVFPEELSKRGNKDIVLQKEGERGKKKICGGQRSQGELVKSLNFPQLKSRSVSQEQSTHPSALTLPSPFPLPPKHSKKIARTSLRAPWKIPRTSKLPTCKPPRSRRRKPTLPYAILPSLLSTDILASKLEELLSRGVSGWQREWQGRRPREIVNLAP